MQEVIDHVDAFTPLMSFIPASRTQTITTTWSGLHDQIAHLRTNLDEAVSDSDLVSGTASLTSASTTTLILNDISQFQNQSGFDQAWENYVRVISRPDLNAEVRELLRRFHLDEAPPGEKSALELFDIAQAAYSSPVTQNNPISTSLLPIRECIQAVVSQLLRMRPFQEPTGSSEREKVRSIGRQLRRSNVGDELIDAWAEEWHTMNDKSLSGSKRAQVSREKWTIRLVSATRFLHSLLSELDATRLRR